MAIFLDLAKAFNSVNHKLLLKKLKNVGIRGNLLRWITSYLDNRNQLVRNSLMCSDKYKVKSGVPQGSVLGPTIFLLYINDIKHLNLKSQINLFADDTMIYSSNKNSTDLITQIQEDLDTVTNWCTYNKLCLNAKKTNALCFSTSFKRHLNLTQIPRLRLLGHDIEYKETCDYLGIRLDYKLNMNSFLQK